MLQAESREGEQLDRAAFDYSIAAGLEEAGVRADKPICSRPAVSATREAMELEGATFAPQLGERTRRIAAEAQPRAAGGGRVFEDLYSQASRVTWR